MAALTGARRGPSMLLYFAAAAPDQLPTVNVPRHLDTRGRGDGRSGRWDRRAGHNAGLTGKDVPANGPTTRSVLA